MNNFKLTKHSFEEILVMGNHPLLSLMPKKDIKLIDQFLENLRKQNKSEETFKAYSEDLKRFLEWLILIKEKNLSSIKSQDIGDYLEYLKNGGFLYTLLSPQKKPTLWHNLFKKFRKKVFYKKRDALGVASTKRHLSTLKNFYEFLKESYEEKNQFTINPVKSKIHHIKLKDKDTTPTPMLTREDFELLYEKIYRTEERLMLYLLYYGGLRLKELANLTFGDFNEKSHSIKLLRKGGDIHHLIIRKPELIFKEWLFFTQMNAHHTNLFERHLFVNSKGQKLNERSLFNRIKKICRKAGLKSEISPHSFRKACATEYYLETKDLLRVRDYLNHSDAKVTQTYIDKLTLYRYSREQSSDIERLSEGFGHV